MGVDTQVGDAHAIIKIATPPGAVGAVQDVGEVTSAQLRTVLSEIPVKENTHTVWV